MIRQSEMVEKEHLCEYRFIQNLSASFIFQEECRMKIGHVLFLSVFSNLRIRVSEGHFQCVHTIRFSEPIKTGSLKNGSCERALTIT